jgi:hypothetical protein
MHMKKMVRACGYHYADGPTMRNLRIERLKGRSVCEIVREVVAEEEAFDRIMRTADECVADYYQNEMDFEDECPSAAYDSTQFFNYGFSVGDALYAS